MTILTTFCSCFRTVLITNTKDLNHHHHNCSRSPNHQRQKRAQSPKILVPLECNSQPNVDSSPILNYTLTIRWLELPR